jgi:signal transduction histidine kinase/ligand-binding sensor domain-containing protein
LRVRSVPALVVCLTLLTALAPPVCAQNRFDSWNTENGLPQNSVNDILQTRDGYLWLATFGGLVRFDGIRFAIFDRSTPGIESQRLTALHQDRNGVLWAASEDGMLVQYDGNRFTTYSSRDGLPPVSAVRIEEDEEGCLWVTWRDRITRFDGRRFETLGPDHFAKGLAVPPPAHYYDAWWAQDVDGLHVLVKGGVRTFSNHLVGPGVRRVTPDWRGNVWIVTRDAGVIRASGDRLRRFTTRDGLPTDHPDGLIAEGRDDDVWVMDRGVVYRARYGKADLVRLPGAPIFGWRSFYVDDEGSTWLGSTATGLHRVIDATITVHSETDAFSLKAAYSILEDRTGAILLNAGGLKRYSKGRWTALSSPRIVEPDAVRSIYEDKAGRVWVGTSSAVGFIDRGRYQRYAEDSPFLNDWIAAILEDRSGAFWFAAGSGLVRSAEGRLTKFTTRDGLSHDRVISLFEDRSGVLWIGTFRGLTRLEAGRFRTYRESDGFIGNAVRAFHEDADGFLWVGTYDGGLYRLANGRLTRFTRTEGLHDNGVFQILEDGNGFFWMGSNRGISRVSRKELNDVAEGRRRSVMAVALGPADGLSSVEVNGGAQPSGLVASDGRLWFPTMGGAAVINPAVFEVRSKPPPALIEEFRLNGEPVEFAGGVRFSAGGAFEIRYTAPSFVKPLQVRFRYRVLGLGDGWTDAGDRRSISFHGLAPGSYRFEVRAASHDGVWNTTGPHVEIVVVPPFWRTWWFLGLAFAGAIALAFGGHVHRVRRLQAQHALQEQFSQRLIDAQERERRRVSSEMHDSLGQHVALIKRTARSGLAIAADGPAAEAAFDEIAALAEAVNAEMTEIAYAVRPHQLDTIGLSRTIETMVTKVGRACDLQLEADVMLIDDRFPEASHIHIFRIVQEAVSNIVKHSQATSGRVAISRNGRSVEITVQDNGIGFGPDEIESARSASHGAGLVGIRERARILGGRVEIRSRVPRGTTITVTLPLEGATHG